MHTELPLNILALIEDILRFVSDKKELEFRVARIKLLQEYFLSHQQSHLQAEKLVQSINNNKSQFALFLNSFSSSGKSGERFFSEALIEEDSRHKKGSLFWQFNFTQKQFHQTLINCLNQLPVFGIANNSAYDLGTVPMLSLHKSVWIDAVNELIRAAPLIFCFIEKPSAGVIREMTFIRDVNKAQQTILIQNSDANDVFGMFAKHYYDEQQLTAFRDEERFCQEKFNDVERVFPCKVTTKQVEENPQLLAGLIEKILAKNSSTDFVPLSFPPMPENVEKKDQITKIKCSLITGKKALKSGDITSADYILHRALVEAFAFESPELQADILSELAHFYFSAENAISYAPDYLERAVDSAFLLKEEFIFFIERIDFNAILSVTGQDKLLNFIREKMLTYFSSIAGNDQLEWHQALWFGLMSEIEILLNNAKESAEYFEKARETYVSYRLKGGSPKSKRAMSIFLNGFYWSVLVQEKDPALKSEKLAEYKSLELCLHKIIPQLNLKILQYFGNEATPGELEALAPRFDELVELRSLISYIRKIIDEEKEREART